MKNNLQILYEDNHIIVVIKPFNVLSQSDNTNDLDMLTIIKNYLKVKYNKPGNVYLGLVHRLDRPTGGIMVFAKTSKAASRLSDEIRNNQFHKKYLAIVKKLKVTNGKFVDYLEKTEDNSSKIVDSNHGKYSELSFITKKTIDNLSLVDIQLITGRHHQIRVQFSSRGYPIYGDQRYGQMDNKQLALYAYYLSFIHPVTKEQMMFEYFPDKVGIWKEFL